MYQKFHIGQQTDTYAHTLDVSKFPSIEQLRATLAEVFGFADAKTLWLVDENGNPLSDLQSVATTTDNVEVRATAHESIREPPGPRVIPFVGNRYELYPDILGNYDRLFSLYGPMIKTVNMGTTIYHTNDPAIARHVLREDHLFTKTTSDPSHPLHYMADQDCLFTCDSASPAFAPSHKFVPPTMSPRAIAHFLPLIQDAAQSIFPAFDHLADANLAINVYQYMFKLAAQIVWRVMLNQDLKHFESPKTPPSFPVRLFGQYLSLMKKSSMRPQWIKYLPFGDTVKLKSVRQQVLDTTEEAMKASVQADGPPLSLSEPTAIQSATCVADFLYRARDKQGKGLPYELVLGNVVVSCGAGFTTSSSLLSWALYSVVRYPGNQQRLFEEISSHRSSNDGRWTYDDIHGMKFLDCFVKEVLRLHSPSFQTARNAKQDAVLPGGYLIPKGSIVIACFPSLHKNPAHWENPQRFDPHRWAQQGLATQMARQGSYTPFAAGARGCVGFNLALTQVKIVLVELVYRYEFDDSSPETVVYDPEFLVVRPLNFYAGITRRMHPD
ncbi:cytochrome P450 [Aspergillus novofumigatus IBT 16806]|uniref:Putative cytochrome P450 monooxygenase n=1 Tax=Aspergillus novofumigatus (strain IBT 16806) TaxID=1392255 RepID=A0A2I1CJP7_ASPN1|nr:putative cytochrome P450 monooxygenase [Aspergillus novofumigatus IBT 16806]PKX97844.1 putative cytochrome P450 monooxygenase [Aspergillus novofumigatus IBT 16806]